MEHHEIIVDDGTRLRFGLTGPEHGPAVMLCHGLGAAGAQFAADAAWFAEYGFRVLVPDLRGHGRSGMPKAPTRAGFAPGRLRADVYAMLDHAGIAEVHWIGNSLGGILGLGAAAEAPQRLASLGIFGTALALNLPAQAWMLGLIDIVPGRKLAAAATARSTTRNRAAWPLIATMLNQYDARAAGTIVAHISRYDLTEAALNWTGPGLVLVGGADRAVNRALMPQLRALEDRPNWRIAKLPQGGHCANLDATDDWRDALLAFWQR